MPRPLGFLAALLALFLVSSAASAFPGFYAGKGSGKRYSLQSQIVLAERDGRSVMTVLSDYGGGLDDFAVVLAVPADVTLERVKTIRRDFVDRMDQVTAPRFHEFWEMDPCEPGPAQQIWDVSLSADTGTAFLGGGSTMMGGGSSEKVPKEMLIKVEPEFKDTSGEYTFAIVPPGEDVVAWLKGKGYEVGDAASKATAQYADMAFLIAEVSANKLELVAGGRAQLSPIRFWSEKPIRRIPAKLGRLSAKGFHDMIVYVLHPKDRFEVKNYGNVYPPTNLEVDFKVKERMGEFYAGLHDALLAKDPKAFLVEWVGGSGDCGKPCATAEPALYEVLSLGADVFETFVPEEERNPEVPELTKEEKKALEDKIVAKIDAMEEKKTPAQKAKLKKEMLKLEEERRIELARRKALILRNDYVVTRLHHRYEDAGLPEDPVVAEASGNKYGGYGLPKGPSGELSRDVAAGPKMGVQLRYVFLHPWAGMQKCEKPERWRWGKPPRTYRGRRKIWIAQELGTMDRKDFELAQVVKTPVPSLGLPGIVDAPKDDAGKGDAGTAEGGAAKKSCGCRTPGSRTTPALGLLLVGLSLAGAARRFPFYRSRG